MPTKIIMVENAKKHYTNREKAARSSAEAKYTRDKVRMVAPEYIKDDKTALKYWKLTVKNLKAFGLLDDADVDTLGTYCKVLARIELLRTKIAAAYGITDEKDALLPEGVEAPGLGVIDLELIKRAEANERLQLMYATKLGLTPEARLRMAKREAEQQPVDENDELYGTA